MCSGSEAGSYLKLKDSGITQLNAQGSSRTCYESKEEEEGCTRRTATWVSRANHKNRKGNLKQIYGTKFSEPNLRNQMFGLVGDGAPEGRRGGC